MLLRHLWPPLRRRKSLYPHLRNPLTGIGYRGVTPPADISDGGPASSAQPKGGSVATSTTESSAGRTTERSSRRDGEVVQYIGSALDVIHGRWKVRLLFLMARGIHRHGKLLQALPGTSKKVITGTLRQLERDGLVERTTPGGRSAGE